MEKERKGIRMEGNEMKGMEGGKKGKERKGRWKDGLQLVFTGVLCRTLNFFQSNSVTVGRGFSLLVPVKGNCTTTAYTDTLYNRVFNVNLVMWYSHVVVMVRCPPTFGCIESKKNPNSHIRLTLNSDLCLF